MLFLLQITDQLGAFSLGHSISIRRVQTLSTQPSAGPTGFDTALTRHTDHFSSVCVLASWIRVNSTQECKMNKVYKSVWNESIGAWVAVSETAAARGKKASRNGGPSCVTWSAAALAVPLSISISPVFAANLDTDAITIIYADGNAASATSPGDIAIGKNAVANSNRNSADHAALAVGFNANANANRTVAMGMNSSAVADDAVALGYSTVADAMGSVALGQSSNT